MATATKRMKHTPGPWSVDASGEILAAADSNDSRGPIEGRVRIAKMLRHRLGASDRIPGEQAHDSATPGCQEANAHLIAAAPSLLSALAELLKCTLDPDSHGGVHMDDAITDAREAIALAKGRAA